MYRKLFIAMLIALPLSTMARQLHLQTPHLSMVINADEGKQPEYVYFGSRLQAADLQTCPSRVAGAWTPIRPTGSTRR
jgi:alpha-galactosidase